MPKTHAFLRIMELEALQGATPQAIADLFDMPPKRMWLKGQPERIGSAIPDSSGVQWEIQIEGDNATQEAEDFFDRFHKPLQKLQKTYNCNLKGMVFFFGLAVYCNHGDAPVLNFRREFLNKLQATQCELDIDIYPMHPVSRPKVGVSPGSLAAHREAASSS